MKLLLLPPSFLFLSAVAVVAASPVSESKTDGASVVARTSSLRGANNGSDIDRVLQGTAENARVKVVVVTRDEDDGEAEAPPAVVYDPNMPVNRVGPNAKPGVSSPIKITIVKRSGPNKNERDEGENP